MIDQRDPFTGTYTLSRGIVGSRNGRPCVGAPLHKQVFSLDDGQCFDDPEQRVAAHRARVRAGRVEVGLTT